MRKAKDGRKGRDQGKAARKDQGEKERELEKDRREGS